MNPFGKYPGLKIQGEFYSKEVLLAGKKGTAIQSKHLQEVFEFGAELFSDSEYIEVQTSGSTGAPKKRKTLKSAIETSALATNAFFGLGNITRAALALPMQYIAGKMMVARAIVGHYELCVAEPSSNPIPGFKVDFMPVIPMQLKTCFDESPERVQNVKTYLVGGGQADDSLRKKIHKSGIDAWYSFGMAETLSHFALAGAVSSGEPIYRPLQGVELGTDNQNRLRISWPGVIEGVLQTNDLVEMVDSGFTWLGRNDNLINSGGVKIIPEQVERQLSPHLSGSFFVAGIPHSKLGEEVVLFAEAEKIKLPADFSLEQPYQKPRKIIYVDAFERTLSGKIRRKATIEKWLESKQ